MRFSLLFLVLLPAFLIAEVNAADLSAVRIPDVKGNLHNAGCFQDVIRNYPSVKTDVINDGITKLSKSAWYKSGTGLTNVDGKASQWNDQSGNGHTARQSNTLFRPTINAADADFNSLGSLTFDGTNDSLLADSLAGFIDGVDAPYTIITVMKKDNTGGVHMLPFGVSDATGNGQWCIGLRHHSREIYLQDKRDEDGLVEIALEVGTSDELVRIVRWQSDGKSAETIVNNASVGSGSLDTAKKITCVYCSIGAFPNYPEPNLAGFNPIKGKLAELIVFNRLLLPPEQALVENYCNAKFATY